MQWERGDKLWDYNQQFLLYGEPLELAQIQVMEETLRLQQLLMGTLFNDLAITNDDDPLPTSHGWWTGGGR